MKYLVTGEEVLRFAPCREGVEWLLDHYGVGEVDALAEMDLDLVECLRAGLPPEYATWMLNEHVRCLYCGFQTQRRQAESVLLRAANMAAGMALALLVFGPWCGRRDVEDWNDRYLHVTLRNGADPEVEGGQAVKEHIARAWKAIGNLDSALAEMAGPHTVSGSRNKAYDDFHRTLYLGAIESLPE